MSTDHIAHLVRVLRTSPSRRAVATTLATLGVTTVLAPLLEPPEVGGKRKRKHKKKHKKKKKLNPQCPSGQVLCDDLQCCATELCTTNGCGCCPATQPNCCGGPDQDKFCYDPAAETCCPRTETGFEGACPQGTYCVSSPDYFDNFCCPSNFNACGNGCCPPGNVCCFNSQAETDECCPDDTCQWWVAFNCTRAYTHKVYPRIH